MGCWPAQFLPDGKKIEKNENSLLTLRGASPYKPVIERGRRAAGAEKFALVKSKRAA
jgi:hypothetical protein